MKVGFVAGVFDGPSGPHVGHRYLISKAAQLCDQLFIGINDNDYIKRKKGREPLCDEKERLKQIRSNPNVWCAQIFSGDSPYDLIMEIKPDILFCGSDYTEAQVVGAKEVKAWGGQVILIERLPEISTSEIIKGKIDFEV